MDVYRKELNDIYEAQRLGEERLDDADVSATNAMAEAMARLNGGCIVITDAASDRCFIFAGSLGRLLGLSYSDWLSVSADSSDEDVIYNLLHPEDLVYKRMLEYEFFKMADSLSPEHKRDIRATCRIRMRAFDGRYILIDNSTQVSRLSPCGKIWLILCTYQLSPTQEYDSNIGIVPRIVNQRTGEIVSLSFEERRDRILTSREKEVLRLIRQGLPSKQIADSLGISVNTVNRHRQNIIGKLSVGNSIEAVTAAIKMKLL